MPVAAASDCYVTRHATGVLDGQCQGFDVLLFAGFSAGPKASMLSSIVGDRTGQWSQKTRVVVAGRRVQAWERGRREQEEVIRPFGGVSYRDKPGGGFERRGLFAKFKTPKSGIVGAYCHGPADQYSTEKCTAVLSRIAREGIPGGPVTSSELYVAGVHLDLHKKKCWASNTKRVYCFLDGGMDWYEGSADEMRRREATVIANSHLAGGAEHPSQRPARIERTACNIGKTPSACARVTLFGALDKPSKYYYFAHVQAGNTVTLAHCQRWAIGGNREASLPCKQLFGSFLE